MTDKIKFSFLARPDDLTALAQLASSCDRSSAAMLRKLIRDANTQQKTSLIARTLAGYAMSEASFQPLQQELNDTEFTHTG